ncbi:hypothetical protein VNO77_19572 [Canavalia gladiata]|uniref:Uncharacterized protein n=1 Tax=Canavalia gladiata TaxID=3824 RepID=A0AAN9LRJ7_CANGL
MGSLKREKGVLKLVHPGRHIEVHREPIRAAEVMRKNPRHCITRPDIFKLPWIVVKPDSILLPGNVFLIVPNRTIYDLLKAKGQTYQSPSSQSNNQQFKLHMQNVCQYDWKERSRGKCVQNRSESRFEFRPYYKAVQYYSRDIEVESVSVSHDEQVTVLKSCLRKPDSVRKSLNLKVSFNMSIQEEDQPWNIQDVS